jgi:hypothetical protein
MEFQILKCYVVFNFLKEMKVYWIKKMDLVFIGVTDKIVLVLKLFSSKKE